MKNKRQRTAIPAAMACMVLLAMSGFAVPLESWTFNDAAGTDLRDSSNSGTLNSSWNFGGPASIAQDGSGNLVISNQTGQVYRKLPKGGTANAAAGADQYAVPFTSGVYRIQLDFTSWALDSSAATDGTVTYSALSAASGSTVAAIRLRILDDATGRLQLFADLAGTAQGFRNFDFGLTNSAGISAMIEFDFDADTVTYFTNGVQTHSFSDFEATQLATLSLNTDNNWISNSTVTINAMLFETDDPPTDVYIADKGSFTSSATAPSTNSISFSVQEGDVIAFLSASNKGTDPTTNSLTFSGTASIDAIAYDRRAQGATASYWYTTALSDGTVDMELITVDSYTANAGYLLRAPDGETVTFLDASKAGGSDLTSITNTYNGGVASGIFLEAASTYGTTLTPLNPATVVYSAQGDNRKVVDGVFTNASPLLNIWTNTVGHVAVAGLLFDSVATATSPQAFFTEWLSLYPGLGGATNLSDNPDLDAGDNLYEYAMGGDPTNGGYIGIATVAQPIGGGVFEFIHVQRSDAAARGLSYTLNTNLDLVFNQFTNANYTVVGTNTSYGVPGFEEVTNHIPTDVYDAQFVELEIGFTP